MSEQRAHRGRAAWRRGLVAEWLAEAALRLKGWRVIGRRVRTPVGELDLIITRGDHLVFVEVKARPDQAAAAAAIHPRAAARLARAAAWFVQRRPQLAAKSMRFDAMLVEPWRWPRHIENVIPDSGVR